MGAFANGRICICLSKKKHPVLNNVFYLISLDQGEMKIKQIKMQCVNLEKEIEDGNCVTGISVIDKIFGDFLAQPVSVKISVFSKF